MQGRHIYILACKVLRKMRLNHLSYRIIHNFVRHQSVNIADTEQCEELLSKVYPDQGMSCVVNTPPSISKSYDLQIIIPAYNVGQYISECLDSVFSQQTNYRYLVVVVNDGSTDNTAKELSKYEHHTNLKIINQENRGFSGARNRALETIESEYITFLDSDDQLMPFAIENMLRAAYKHDCDMVAGGHLCFTEGKVLSTFPLEKREENNYLTIPGYPWGKVYRSSIYTNVHFPEKYWFEDTLVSMILLQKCNRIVSIPDLVYRYRKNNQGISATATAKPKSLDSFWITKRLLEDRRTLGIEEDPSVFATILLRQIYINFSRIYTLGNKEVDKAVFSLSVKMIEDHITSRPSHLGKYEALYDALITHNYLAYKQFCMLL